MDSSSISPQDVTTLIDHLLKSKDPAEVGLKRIVKNKVSQQDDFPLRSMSFDEFASATRRSAGFSEDELHVLKLEKEVRRLGFEQEKLKKQAVKEREEAYLKGKEEGRKEGEQIASAREKEAYQGRLSELQQRLGTMTETWAQSSKDMLLQSQKTLSNLAYEIACKVVHAEIRRNPDVILSVTKRALSYLAERQGLVIRVHPDEWETVSANQDFWKPVQDRLTDVKIVADEQVEPGGCLIESGSGQVDARVGTQCNELRELIEQTWESLLSAAESESRLDEPVNEQPQAPHDHLD